MNYRHAFHAGNFADVVKHAVLCRIVEYLKHKDAAFRVIDTHAGRGRYDLTAGEAERTGEWHAGIGRLLAAQLPGEVAALLSPYLDAVRSANDGPHLTAYPGSPLIVRHLLRRQDRLSAIEMHADEAEALRRLFAGDVQVRVTALDGWLALGAHVPPKERRGLVLVDPPFEVEGEFARMVDGLARAHQRWPGGVYAFWYPVKDRRAVDAFRQALAASGIPRILDIVLMLRAPSKPERLDGTGMIVVNPPHVLPAELGILLPALARILGAERGQRADALWLAGESA